MFRNRTDAGKSLARNVAKYIRESGIDPTKCVVVALPRGGVPVGYEVARQLNCPLTVCCAKKIPCPGQPEYAIGAVSSNGTVIYDGAIRSHLAQFGRYLEQQSVSLIAQAKQREAAFLREANIEGVNYKGTTVILVDDGVATGMTAVAAMRTLKELGAAKIILATPVICSRTVPAMLKECDEVIAVVSPEEFQAVGLFYVDFTQTTDEEAVEYLRRASSLSRAS